VGAARSRRWCRQGCSSGGLRRREGQLGWTAERRGVLGEGQQEGGEAVGELEGDVWRSGELVGGLGRRGTMAYGGTAAQQRGGRGRRRGGGRQWLNCKL
jgi:hypothetical protein